MKALLAMFVTFGAFAVIIAIASVVSPLVVGVVIFATLAIHSYRTRKLPRVYITSRGVTHTSQYARRAVPPLTLTPFSVEWRDTFDITDTPRDSARERAHLLARRYWDNSRPRVPQVTVAFNAHTGTVKLLNPSNRALRA